MPIPVVRPWVEFQGIRYYLDNDGYYKASRCHGRGLLHRAIWSAVNGRSIPDGWHVHHKDHDRSNNDQSNLVAMSGSAHQRYHKGEQPTGAALDTFEERSRKRTDEWTRKEYLDYTCRECGEPYKSRSNKPTHYCSRKCCDKAMGRRRVERDRQRREAGLRPDGERAA